jgi:hypothetical protein
MNRREFGAAALGLAATSLASAQSAEAPEVIRALRPMTGGILRGCWSSNANQGMIPATIDPCDCFAFRRSLFP